MSDDWSPFDVAATPPMDDDTRVNTANVFAAVFRTAGGTFVLNHLEKITTGVALPPSATDAQLRHLEGQRCLVHHIRALISRAG